MSYEFSFLGAGIAIDTNYHRQRMSNYVKPQVTNRRWNQCIDQLLCYLVLDEGLQRSPLRAGDCLCKHVACRRNQVCQSCLMAKLACRTALFEAIRFMHVLCLTTILGWEYRNAPTGTLSFARDVHI